MSTVSKYLGSRFVKETLSGTVAQLICYLLAISVLGLGVWLLPQWLESSRDVVFGILILTTVSLLLATLGSLAGLIKPPGPGKTDETE
jgi:hypothetical protein